MSHPLLASAQGLHDWLVQTRRTLHMAPELSLHEFKTAEYCATELEKLGLKVTREVWGQGLVADLDVPGAERRVALRADMDALPIQELNDVPYCSKHDGVAHMCGHDTHMAIGLGTARLLSENRDKLTHSVRFLFQPSEELPPGGALGMIENGALDGVDEVYGLHNHPLLEVGRVDTRVGPITAAADIFEITITGKGGHAAKPHEALDPIPVAAALVSQLQTLVSRRVAPGNEAVVSVTKLKAGTTHNIIPDQAELMGTVRTFDPADRDMIEAEMGRMSQAVASAHGLEAELKYTRGYDSIVNHAESVAALGVLASEMLGAENVNTACGAQTWGEDFAYYLQHRRGAFYLLGSGNRDKGITEPLHSPRFNVDESCLPIGVALMARLAGYEG
jgi:amidohydrolase